MSRLALGTVQFGLNYGISNKAGMLGEDEVKKILDLARISGIFFLDTAIAYGKSEYVLGKVGVQDFKVITKIPQLPKDISDVESWVHSQIEASLGRLNISALYGVLLHMPKDLLYHNGAKLSKALEDLRRSSLVKKVGISIYDVRDINPVRQLFEFDLLQAPLNLIDRQLETTGALSTLKRWGVEVHTRSAFLQGLLLMTRQDIPKKFEYWSHIWDQWHFQLKISGISPLTACLSYPLSLPEVDRVIVGVDSLLQLDELIKNSVQSLNPENWQFMASNDENLINPSLWSKLQ
jgi:aryl-alcohol dehydrogenase-like predicted oxidoreductase